MQNQEVKPKRGRPRRDLKDELAQKAIALFLSRGFHQTRIEDIITEMGMGKGTFYLHFKNKEEIVHYAIDEVAREIETQINWFNEDAKSEKNILEVFKAESRKLVLILEKNQDYARFLFRQGRAISEDVASKINHYYNRIVSEAEASYQLGMDQGILAKGNPRIDAMCVLGGVLQVFHHHLEGELNLDAKVIADEVTVFFFRALGLKA